MARGERLILEVDAASEPIAGRVQWSDGSKSEFHGYMALISLLEQARGEPVGETASGVEASRMTPISEEAER